MTDVELQQKLVKSLATIGKDEKLRSELVEQIKHIEKELQYDGNVREEITGNIVDAIFSDADVLRKELSSGVVFEFVYRSKIARDFLMSAPTQPNHVWEPQTSRLLVYLASKTQNVVIGGAYFGDQAILVAKELEKTGGVCHAFEPNKEQFEMLVRNAEINHLKNVKTNRMGLWNEDDGIIRLVGSDAYGASELADADAAAVTDDENVIRTTKIDTYLKKQGVDKIGLIMLDTEGSEHTILLGADEQLNRPVGECPNVVFEIHRDYVDWSEGLPKTDIVRYLMDCGYTVFAIRDFQSNREMSHLPIELIPAESAYLEGPPHAFNMLAIKDLTILEDKLFKICHNISPKLIPHKDPKLHHPTDGW
jgi:FkbM family methyltransferase